MHLSKSGQGCICKVFNNIIKIEKQKNKTKQNQKKKSFQQHWATPFEIHTPPVEDFGKVYHSGSVNLIPMRCTCDTHEVCM